MTGRGLDQARGQANKRAYQETRAHRSKIAERLPKVSQGRYSTSLASRKAASAEARSIVGNGNGESSESGMKRAQRAIAETDRFRYSNRTLNRSLAPCLRATILVLRNEFS